METVFFFFASVLAFLLSLICIGVIWKFFFDFFSKRKAVKKVRRLMKNRKDSSDGTKT